jgi:hypothetical protein
MPGGGEHGSQPGCRCGPHLRSQGVSATEPGLEEAATLPMPEQLRAAALARRPRGSISARPHTGRQSAHVQRHRRGNHSPTARETRATPRARKASLSTSPGSTTPQPPAACRLPPDHRLAHQPCHQSPSPVRPKSQSTLTAVAGVADALGLADHDEAGCRAPPRLCAQNDAAEPRRRNVRPCRTAGAPGDAGHAASQMTMRGRRRRKARPTRLGRPWAKPSSCPAQSGSVVLGLTPCAVLDICPYAPRLPGLLPDGVSGYGCPDVTAPHFVDLRVRQLRFGQWDAAADGPRASPSPGSEQGSLYAADRQPPRGIIQTSLLR